MTQPLMALVCPECGWRPEAGVTMGLVRAHIRVEHSNEDVNLDLVPYCPRDMTKLEDPAVFPHSNGRTRHSYDCPSCRRTYDVVFTPS